MDALLRSILQQDYKSYCEVVNDGWIRTPFHAYLCDRVQEFVERKTERAFSVLIINTPPQHGKSMTVTETLPSWYLGRHKTYKVIEVSYNEDFAQQFGRENRRKINEYGQEIFGISLAKTPNTTTEFKLGNHRGGMISRGLVSGVTGKGANLFIIDDPVKTQAEADSEVYRRMVWSEWMSSYLSRLAPDAKVIVIMTRWHEDDLAGRLIAAGHNVEVINLPCEAEAGDLLGREIGEPLCPEIGKGKKWLEDFKGAYVGTEGSRSWNALFQGRPSSAQGNILKREWWGSYEELPEIASWVMSVDAAFKDKEDNDFVAIQVWGKTGPNIYLIDALKKHLDMPSTVREIARLRAMYPLCKTTLIEDKANGSAIIQVLRSSLGGIIPVLPKGGKVARVNAVSGTIESGNVYLPVNKPFTGDFIDECASFPYGKHDDQVDAMSQALTRLIYQGANLKPVKEENPLFKAFPSLRRKPKHGRLGQGERVNVI